MGSDAATITGPVPLDNTVLTNLALVGREELVRRVWPVAVCTSASVLHEYGAGAASGLLPPDAWGDLPVLALTAEETAFARTLPPRLGAGERDCLAIAIHRQGLLASDDLDTRHLARSYGVSTTGTVGILVLTVRQGMMTRGQANAALTEMIQLGYRSPVITVDPLV